MAESHLYVDQYLRRKRGPPAAPAADSQRVAATALHAIQTATAIRTGAGVATTTAAVTPTAALAGGAASDGVLNEHIDAVTQLSQHVQGFVERSDTTNLQVQALEDKVMNLAKMLKLSQTLADEREGELKSSNRELRQRVQRLEDANGRLLQLLDEANEKWQAEMDGMKAAVPAMIQAAVESPLVIVAAGSSNNNAGGNTSRGGKQQPGDQAVTLQEAFRALEKAQEESRQAAVLEAVAAVDESVDGKLQAEAQRTSAALRDVQHKCGQDILEVSRTAERAANLDSVRKVVEDRVAVAGTGMRDGIMTEVRTLVKASQDASREDAARILAHADTDTTELRNKVLAVEQKSGSIDAAFYEFLGSFQDHTRTQASKAEETAQSMREMMELHEQTRSVVASELETTKQWAARNMHRLKKHLDLTNTDVAALRDSVVEHRSVLEKLKVSQDDEQERLRALLAQKSKEAAVLSGMVDREIQSVHDLTAQHRVKSAVREASASAEAVEEDQALHRFQERAATRRANMKSLFDDLSFKP